MASAPWCVLMKPSHLHARHRMAIYGITNRDDNFSSYSPASNESRNTRSFLGKQVIPQLYLYLFPFLVTNDAHIDWRVRFARDSAGVFFTRAATHIFVMMTFSLSKTSVEKGLTRCSFTLNGSPFCLFNSTTPWGNFHAWTILNGPDHRNFNFSRNSLRHEFKRRKGARSEI